MCTEDCDGGSQFRNYTINRLPTNGGKRCPTQTQKQSCNTEPCPRDPVTLNGYTDNGVGVGKVCSGTEFYSSADWELVNPGEDKVNATSFDDPYYQKYQRRAALKCNEDDRCDYVTVSKNGTYRTFGASQCVDMETDGNAVTWKKEDDTLAGKDVPISFFFDPQIINGYTSQTKKQDPLDKFSWRPPKETDEGWMCSADKVEGVTGVDTQGPEVSFDSEEYKEYVKNVQAKCELEYDCNYISVSKSGAGNMYKECADKRWVGDDARWKSFKRNDDQPMRTEPPEKIDGHSAEFMGYKPVTRYNRCTNTDKALANEFIREEGEEKVKWNDFFSWKYQRLLKRGIELCNKDPDCQYLDLAHKDATARTFKKKDCDGSFTFDTGHKIWEKGDWKDTSIQDPIHGYEQYGSKFLSCGISNPQSGWISQGVVSGRKGEAESFTKADKTIDDTYSEYLKQGAMICNDDPNCNYVSVWLDGTYRTFDNDACTIKPMVGYSDVKTWKKKDSSVVGTVPPPPPPPPPPEKHGYVNIHNEKTCPQDKQNWVQFSGSTHEFESTKYDDNLKSGIMKCNDDPKCKYVTAFKDGLTGLVSEGDCDSPSSVQNAKIWEKNDPNVIGFSPPPAPPKPPPYTCDGSLNTQIRISQVNDGNCDCIPGFDDEPTTGVCKPKELGHQLNDISLFDTYYTPKQIATEKPATTYNFNVAKGWSGGYTSVSDPYGGGGGKYAKKYTGKTAKTVKKSQLPYLIKEDKSGWTKKVFVNKTLPQCKSISVEHPRSPGYSYFKKGLDGKGEAMTYQYYEHEDGIRGDLVTKTMTGNQPVCVVYGGNTGKGTDKKCVKDHDQHKDCWEREPTESEISYNTFKPGEMGTFWNWGKRFRVDGQRAENYLEWMEDKYWA